ncbi:MAG: NADH-quinone oxidoreductase subunit NuoK [Bdellovibrionales bacterium]
MTSIGLPHYLALSSILFVIGLMGVVLNRRNIIILLMAVELMLLAALINFVAFSYYSGDISGQVMAFAILTVAAAESAIGLAILVISYRQRRSIEVDDLSEMKG